MSLPTSGRTVLHGGTVVTGGAADGPGAAP